MSETQTAPVSQGTGNGAESGTYLVFERMSAEELADALDRFPGATVYVLVDTRHAAGRKEAISAHVADLDEGGEWKRGTSFASTTDTYFFEWAPSGKKTSYS